MITIHSTKKLFAKLPVDENGQLPLSPKSAYLDERENSEISPLSGWHANLDWWFSDALMNTLLKCNASNEQMDRAGEQLQRLQFDTVCDRSVQGTMNRMAQDIEWHQHYESVDVAEITGYRLSAWMADQLCGMKGRKDYITPYKEFFALLDALPRPDTVAPDNVIDFASHQRSGDSTRKL